MGYKYTNEILKRSDLQHIRQLLLDEMNIKVMERDEQSYEERLNQGRQNIIKRIENISKNVQEFDEIFAEYIDAEYAYTKVFFELGMKAGAKLIFQLLHQDN